MKKIIEGATYDTDKAEQLGSDSFSNSRDFHHWEETLYRSKSGRYFLYGEGGPMSRYARTVGQNEWSGGEQIMPMDRKAAMAWAEEHLTGDQYTAIFGDPEEGWENINVRLTAAAVSKLRSEERRVG